MSMNLARTYWVIFLFCIVPFAFSGTVKAPVESDLTESSFPPLSLPSQIFSFPNPDFVEVALKIQLGTASIQERRAWYRAAERYAPFSNAPASDWKVKASQAAAALDPAANGSSEVIYQWTSVGPKGDYDVSNVWGPPYAKNTGRATAIWTDLDGATTVNKNILFVGYADGGVWKSVDGGNNWVPLTDFQPSISIGALDVLPGQDRVNYSDAIVYVGTGEGNFSISDKDGVGVLKSTNGGKTWTVQQIPWQTDVVGAAGLHRIRRLRIDRNVPNAQSVWVAGDGGVYHTADGGTTWSLVTGLPYAGASATAAFPGGCWIEYATDFVVNTVDKPSGFSTLLAAYGRYNNASCAATPADARKNNGVYRSTDGGVTWQKISLSGQNGFATIPGNVARVVLLAAPSNPKHIYVLIGNSSNHNSLGIWDTLDSTANPVQWTAGSTTNFTSQQAWYDITGAVDPTNENKLMVGGLDNWISTDRGVTITTVSGWSASDNTWAHADHHHAIWADANTYYDANDGGLNVGTINGTTVTWTHRNAGTVSTLQFYGLSQSATDPYRINGGLQDNGHAYLDSSGWRTTYGGDGGFACTNQDNDNEAYEEYVYAAIRNSDDGGQTWPDLGCMQDFGGCVECNLPAVATGVICVPDMHTAFIANFILDTNNQNIMYVGTNYLYRNPDAANAGKAWVRIASDGLNGDFVKGSTSGAAYITIVHTPKASPVSGNPAISQTIYLGTSTGRIWKTTDGGVTWTDLTKAPLPIATDTSGRFLSWIDTDPTDANKVVITYSGWNNSIAGKAGHVFRSVDGGQNWTDISGALPDEPFNSVAVNPNDGHTSEIFVASDSGVYVNNTGWTTNTWIRTNSGLLPHVSVNMLQFTNATNPKRLRAATHGRGIWELFTECAASVTLDKSEYTCNDTVKISVQEPMGGPTTLNVQVFSGAEATPENVVVTEFPAGSGHYIGEIPTSGGSAVTGDGKISVFNVDNITVRYVDPSPCSGSPSTIEAKAISNCNTCTGSGGSGSNLEILQSSVSFSGGDNDEFLDNCEQGTVNLTVRNDGSGDLKNVRITNVTPSNPAVQIKGLPITISSSLAQCATAAGTITFTAAGLSPNETLQLKIDVTSDELTQQGVSRSVTVEYKNTEQDFTFVSSKTFSFENDLEGWSMARGSYERTNANGGGALLTSYYLASHSLTAGICDEARSPIVKLTSTSNLELYTQFTTEPYSGSWFDRANVGVYDLATDQRTNVVPSGGRPYIAEGPNGVCVTGGQPGWAGPGLGWLPSSWTSTDLKTADFADKKVQIDVAYGTDSLVSGSGFWFDHVTLTNFYLQIADAQTDQCPSSSCGPIDDSDPAVEYTGGWHLKKDTNASSGGYHRRVGSKNGGAQGAPTARLVFDGTGITYFYAISSDGGTADVYIDNIFRETISYAGAGALTFGQSKTYSNLTSGSHEIRIVHRSGIAYIDGFECSNGNGPSVAAAQYSSVTETSDASSTEGPIITRNVQIGANDVEVSVVVEGISLPVTVNLLGPSGNLLASGQALISGLSLSGLDSSLVGTGTYKVQFVNNLAPGKSATVSIARTVRTY